MKIVNGGLPGILAKAIANNTYDAPDSYITVTRLEDSPRILQLIKRHGDNIEVDAADMVWSLMGQAMHVVLERGDHGLALKEERFHAELDGRSISGRIDLYDPATYTLYDLKFVSAWSFVFSGGMKPEWIGQLNDLAWLMGKSGHEVKRLVSCQLFRDWSEREAQKNSDYPQQKAIEVEVPLHSAESWEGRMRERLALHVLADALPDAELPLCSPEERWTKKPTYALMKEGRQSAIKVEDTESDIYRYAQDKGIMVGKGGHYIVKRPGEETRCARFCQVWSVCDFGKKVRACT